MSRRDGRRKPSRRGKHGETIQKIELLAAIGDLWRLDRIPIIFRSIATLNAVCNQMVPYYPCAPICSTVFMGTYTRVDLCGPPLFLSHTVPDTLSFLLYLVKKEWQRFTCMFSIMVNTLCRLSPTRRIDSMAFPWNIRYVGEFLTSC